VHSNKTRRFRASSAVLQLDVMTNVNVGGSDLCVNYQVDISSTKIECSVLP
jgi:hypothetical protein